MSLLALPLGVFGELSIEKQLLTVVTWVVAAVIVLMASTQGMIGSLPFPVLVIIGALIGLVVAWAVAVVLVE